MAERLDITKPKNIELIDAKYSELVKKSESDAEMEAERYAYTIRYYKDNTLEKIYEDIKKKTSKEIAVLDDDKALVEAIKYELREKDKDGKEKKIPSWMIEGIVKELTDERKEIIIKRYKEKKYKMLVDKRKEEANKNIEEFSLIDDGDEETYVNNFQNLCLARNKFHARKRAIIEAAAELGVEPPVCVSNIREIANETEKVLNDEDKIIFIDKMDEEDKAFKKKIKSGIDKLDNYIKDNLKPTLLSVGVANLSSAIASMLFINAGGNVPEAVGLYVISCPIVFGALSAIYKSSEIREFFRNKKTVREAWDLGLINLMADWTLADKEFSEFDKNAKDDMFSVEIDGGKKNNGLH